MRDSPESEIAELRKESFEIALRSEKRSAAQSLSMNAIILLIDIALFIAHWMIAKRARVQTENA